MASLTWLGVLLYVGGWLWAVVVAFKESPLWGLGVLVVPIFFYVFSRFRRTWPSFACAVAGAVLFFASGGRIPT